MVVSLVGKRNLQPRNFTTGQTSATYRIKYPVAVRATSVQLRFPAWATSAPGADMATGNTVTVSSQVELANGARFPVTFGGATSFGIASGADVLSDVVAGLTLEAGTTAYLRTYVTVASGGRWPALYGAFVFPDEVSRPGANLLDQSGDLQGTGQSISNLYGPVQVIGDVTSPLWAVSVMGDSISVGVNDSFSDESQVGYFQRALYPGPRPFSIVGMPSESASDYLGSARRRDVLIGDYAQYLINEYGVNDLQGGASLATLQSRCRQLALTTASDATLVKRFQQTLGPKTSSTDNWATTTNQTTDGINGTRVAFNDWVRDGMPESSGVAVATGTVGALRAGQAGHPYQGYIEVADLCETSRNSGIWKANYTPDGLTPGPTGNAAIAAALDMSQFANVGPPGLTALFTGSGTLSTTVTIGAPPAAGGLTYVASASPAIRSSPYQGAAASQAWASNSFSPPANSLIVVAAQAVESYNNAWNNPTITSSVALTWTRVDTQANNTFNGVVGTTSLFWALCPTAQTGMTVTVTQSLAGSGQTITFSSVDVRVFTGASTTAPIGATVKGAVTAQNLSVALTPAGTNSALLIAANNAAASSTTTTAGTGEYVAGETHTGTSFVSAWYGTSSGPTVPADAQTLNLTGNAAARWQYIAYELVGASVVSSPAVTASFSGSGSLAAASVERETVAASLTGSGALTATTTTAYSVTAALSGSGGLAAAVVPFFAVAATFTGFGALTATTTSAVVTTALFAGSGSLSAAVVLVAPALPVTAAFMGFGALSAAAVSGAGTYSDTYSDTYGSGSSTPARTATFTSSGVFAADVSVRPAVSASLTSDGTLSAAAVPQYTVTAPFTGTGALSALVGQAGAAVALFTGSGMLSAIVSVQVAATADFTGAGTLSASVAAANGIVAGFTSAGTLTASVTARVAVAAELSGAGLLAAQVALRVALVASFAGSGSLTAARSIVGDVTEVNYTLTGAMLPSRWTAQLDSRRWTGALT